MATRFQFSVRLLLLLTALIASMLGLMCAAPSPQAGACMMLLALLVPSVLFASAMCGRGWVRAFCAGAFVPALAGLILFCEFGLLGAPDEIRGFLIKFTESLCQFRTKSTLGLFWVAMPVTGMASAVCHRMLKVAKIE